MVEGFRIEYLADYPRHIEACAAWTFGRWSVQNENRYFGDVLNKFKDGAQKYAIPLTLIVINEKNGMPVAMASLWEKDSTIWRDDLSITPWITCVYTHYRYRELGMATALLTRIEGEAKSLGYGNVYLQSGSAAGFYLERGFEVIETVETNETKAGTQTLMRKKL